MSHINGCALTKDGYLTDNPELSNATKQILEIGYPILKLVAIQDFTSLIKNTPKYQPAFEKNTEIYAKVIKQLSTENHFLEHTNSTLEVLDKPISLLNHKIIYRFTVELSASFTPNGLVNVTCFHE
jgi:hypothetical protein